MSFAAPLFLIGLAAIPFVAWLYARHERRTATARSAFAMPAVLPSVAPRRAGWRRHAPVALYAIALAGLIVALARPQASVAVPVEQATVMLVTDRSGSMLATDVVPSRLVAARRAGESFLEAVPDDVRVGAVAFNHTARLLQTPTRDHEKVRSELSQIEAAGATATGEALDLALRVAQTRARPDAKPPPAAIVLLSDGKSVRGRDPLDVARRAREAKVPIYTVALGTPGGTIPVPAPGGGTRLEPVPPDVATMQQIAEISGGAEFSVDDGARLREVYEQLGSQVATEKQPREITAAFAGGALLLLAAAAAASLRWFGRVL